MSLITFYQQKIRQRRLFEIRKIHEYDIIVINRLFTRETYKKTKYDTCLGCYKLNNDNIIIIVY